jgi:hypothetical protein
VLLSVKDAVHMAPLYCRLLFRAMSCELSWDGAILELDRKFASSC